MKAILGKLDRFHNSKLGYAVFGLVELALAYLFVSWAIDSGSWLDYALALLFLIGFLQNLAGFLTLIFGRQKGRR